MEYDKQAHYHELLKYGLLKYVAATKSDQMYYLLDSHCIGGMT